MSYVFNANNNNNNSSDNSSSNNNDNKQVLIFIGKVYKKLEKLKD